MSAVQAADGLMVSVHLCLLLLPAALSKGLRTADTQILHVHRLPLVHYPNLVSVTQAHKGVSIGPDGAPPCSIKQQPAEINGAERLGRDRVTRLSNHLMK